MIYRYLGAIFGPFPDVLGYEIPAFEADTKYVDTKTGENTLYTNRQADNTVYSMWIGTNDLGVGALLTDDQAKGTNITTYIDCIYESFDRIYKTGGRYFVLMNTAVCFSSYILIHPQQIINQPNLSPYNSVRSTAALPITVSQLPSTGTTNPVTLRRSRRK